MLVERYALSDDSQSSGWRLQRKTLLETLRRRVEPRAVPHLSGNGELEFGRKAVSRNVKDARVRSAAGDHEASVEEVALKAHWFPWCSKTRRLDERDGHPSKPLFESLINTNERYELREARLRGMGNVSRVKDHMLNRSLAMKTLHAHLLSKDGLVLRFIHEAQVVSQLQHPNIMPVYDIGVLENGQLYFTMAEIKGDSLDKFIKRVHRIPATVGRDDSREEWNLYRLVAVFHDVFKAIAYANERGVIHRDLKPANVMVGTLGEVLVVDWGLAKVVGAQEAARDAIVTAKSTSNADLTMLGAIYGTPGYLAPELANGNGRLPCPTTDVYALGAILYEVLTGVGPFQVLYPTKCWRKHFRGLSDPLILHIARDKPWAA